MEEPNCNFLPTMAKKSSVSSPREKLVRVKAEDILGKPLNRRQRSDLARLKNMPDSEIDYSDIPPLTEEQLATAFRPNKHLVAVRLDREVFEWLRAFGEGYSTRINGILRSVMEHQRSGH
jgi:uncharacterized protein (DUF4415 family)